MELTRPLRDGNRAKPARRRSIAVFGLVFAILFVIAAAWSLATPLFASPDEPDHVIKAVAVAHGQFLGVPTANASNPQTFVVVPASFVSGLHSAACFVGRHNVVPTCAQSLSTDTSPLRVSIYVGRYPPLYYALVGIPSWFSDSSGAVVAMRLISAALSCLFLALAITAAWLWSRRKFAVLGVLLAISPEVLFLAGVVNPSSLEISAAICLWATSILLALGTDAPPTALVVIATLSASTEALCRSLSPLWVAVTGVVALVIAGRRRVLRLLRCRSVQISAGCVVLAAGLASAWTLRYRAFDVQSVKGAAAHAITGSYSHALLARQLLYLHETIGLFGTDNVSSPGLTYRFFVVAVIALAVLALGLARWRTRLWFAVLCAAAFAIPFEIALSQAATRHGLIWQGRDGAPLTLSVPIVAAIVMADRTRGRWPVSALFAAIVVAFGAVEIATFVGYLNRYTNGFDQPFDFFRGVLWQPPLTALVLGVAVLVAVLTGTALVAIAIVRDRGSPETSPVAHFDSSA